MEVDTMLELVRFNFTLIYAISLIYLLLDFDIKEKKALYIIGIFTSIVLIITSFILLTFGHRTFLNLYPFLVHIPSFILFAFISKHKGIKLLFVILTVFILCIPAIAISTLISLLFSYNSTILNLLIIVLYIPSWFIVYKYIRPQFLYMLRNTNSGWFEFSIIPFSYYALLYFTFTHDLFNDMKIYNFLIIVIALILTLASYVVILLLFKQTKQQLTLENNHNLLKTQIAAAGTHMLAIKESQEKTIIYRHDMRHHLNLINAYLIEDNNEAAQNYILDIEKTIVATEVKTYCSNYSVNLILSAYLQKAKQEKIAIETQIYLPHKENVSDMDLCIIFANSIENAINACMLISCIDQRILRVVSKIKDNQIFIQITNSYIDPITFADSMPVNEKDGHGIGTKSIVAIVEKYDGIYSFEAENNLFTLQIII